MGRKISSGLHKSLYKLLDLLSEYNSGSDNINEMEFQQYFEKFDFPWAVLGYSERIPQPRCEIVVEENIQGEYIEPDFFAFNEIRDRWEIVDLKLPKESLQLENRTRRKRFNSSVADYIAQIQEYSDYFHERSHRESVNDRHGVDLPENPPTILIMGSYLEQEEIDKQLRKYSHDISIFPYNRIIDLLEKEYISQSGEHEGLPGITIASRITLMKEPGSEREYIYDIGKSADSDRFSLYLTPNGSLTLEIIPKSNHPLTVSVPWEEIFEIGEQRVVYVEFASTDEMSFSRVFAGTEVLDEMILTSDVAFADVEENSGFQGVDGKYDLYVGANLQGENGASFVMHEQTVLSKAESLDERIRFMKYLQNKREEGDMGVLFKENGYAYTKESSDLVMENEDEVIWLEDEDSIADQLS